MHDLRRPRGWTPAWLLVGLTAAASAQPAPVNGMRPADLRAHALVDVTVVTAPGQVLDRATLVLRDGLVEAVGADVVPPPDARIWNASGLTVYPGLIDAALLVEVDGEPESPGDHWNARVHPQLTVSARTAPAEETRKEMRELGFTVAAVYPEDGVFRGTGVVVALADEPGQVLAYRERAAMAMGVDHGGSWREATYPGSLMGALALIRQTLHDAHWHALCRKVYEHAPDANEPPRRADALVALADVIDGRQPVLFEIPDEQSALRAIRLAREFELDLTLLGSGLEFRRLEEIAAAAVPLVVPLDFPERPELGSLAAAERVSLREMMTWEQAPTNPRRLLAAGAAVALTTHGLDARRDFPRRLHEAIRHGLSEEEALAALTVTPARVLGLEEVLGTIEPGKAANLLVVEGSLFERKPEIREVWINGRRHEIEAAPLVRLVASGVLETDLGLERPVEIDTTKKTVSVRVGDRTLGARKVLLQQDQLSFIIDGRAFETEGWVRLGGVLAEDAVRGTGVLPDGRRFAFSIVPDAEGEAAAGAPPAPKPGSSEADDGFSGPWTLRVSTRRGEMKIETDLELGPDGVVRGTVTAMGRESEIEEGRLDRDRGTLTLRFTGRSGRETELEATVRGERMSGTLRNDMFSADFEGVHGAREDEPFEMPPDELVVPLGAYGVAAAPQPETVLVTNATVWTCGPEGILEGADLLVADGRIRAVGRGIAEGLPAEELEGVRVIDGTGKHVTPGLIDCHSHTGIDGGVNEWTQANTAEVRIADVIDPDDVNWYRQLAGGLVAANQLHGSANPIGGQNSVVKLRWGAPAASFPIEDAPGGIKFALGENVKRSEGRYPDTRMGVETYIRDAFTAALEYRDAWHRYLDLPTETRRRTMPPRRDLELDALVEVIEGERLVHCHSYRQDEILMLVRVAEDFGFTIGTFQHVLEGYKVAEAIAAHGAGASSFSDWWAYKMEVMDAIPHNGALMTRVGAVVSFNSDSSELARRMNTEAAKAVRYGGLDPHDALLLVTLNPARQLGVDHRTGSLEVGKDGDFVIWSADPLSTYARCEQTWIEGANAFSLERDRELRERARRERQRLVQKILADAHGQPTKLVQHEDEGEDEPAAAARPGRRMRGLDRFYQARLEWMEEQVRLGHDPEEIRPGRCACNDTWWRWMMQSRAGMTEDAR